MRPSYLNLTLTLVTADVYQLAGSFGLYQEENATDRSDWNRKSIEQISGIRTIQNGGEELVEYLPYIYHPKMDSENAQPYHQVKTRRFVLDNKHKCQIIRNHSSTQISLPASAILFRKCCGLFQISSGRDGRASKSGRRPIKRTGIVLPIPAALPLAQTNRLNEMHLHTKYKPCKLNI